VSESKIMMVANASKVWTQRHSAVDRSETQTPSAPHQAHCTTPTLIKGDTHLLLHHLVFFLGVVHDRRRDVTLAAISSGLAASEYLAGSALDKLSHPLDMAFVDYLTANGGGGGWRRGGNGGGGATEEGGQ
jgi:hypothetical protein